jgi:hypothetical protein
MKKLLLILILSNLSLSTFARGKREGGEDHAKVRDAVEACFQEKGITRPARGVKLNEDARNALQSCMKGKGFENFKGPRKSQQ